MYDLTSNFGEAMKGYNRRKLMKRLAFVVMLLMGSAVAAPGQDPQEGAKWATNVCGECHAVARSQPRSPNGRAPPFVELANTPGMTTAALTVALTICCAGPRTG